MHLLLQFLSNANRQQDGQGDLLVQGGDAQIYIDLPGKYIEHKMDILQEDGRGQAEVQVLKPISCLVLHQFWVKILINPWYMDDDFV